MKLFNTVRGLVFSSLVVFSGLANSAIIEFNSDQTQVGPLTFENVIGDIDLTVSAGIFFRNSDRLSTPNNTNSRLSVLTSSGLGVQAGVNGVDTSIEIDGSGRNDALVFTFSEEISFLGLNFGNVDDGDTFNFGEINLEGNAFTRSLTDAPILDNQFTFVPTFIGTAFAVGTLIDDSSFTITGINIAEVPEPSTLLIFSLGLIGLTLRLRRSVK